MSALSTNENGKRLDSLLSSLSESLPAGASLKQRTALTAFLGNVFTEAALVQELIKYQKGAQVAAIELCSALMTAMTRSIRAHHASNDISQGMFSAGCSSILLNKIPAGSRSPALQFQRRRQASVTAQ